MDKVIKPYENVSQFWTWPEQEFLAHPVYWRDYPSLKNCLKKSNNSGLYFKGTPRQ